MKKVLKYLFLLFVMLNIPWFLVLAHPGGLDANGCHTCKTNCAKWGLSNGEYHCHNGGNSNSYSSSNTYRTTTTTTKRVYGCTNTEAINYNSTANISDGTCKFEKFETKTETINYETKIDGSSKKGKEKIVTDGQNGEKQIVTKIITDESGNELSREIVAESIIKEPITKIIMYESIKTKERKINSSTKQSQVNNSTMQSVSSEESSDTPFIITMLLLIINIVYGNKHSDCNLIINKIKNIKSVFKYILYFLYFIFVIPVFIDMLLIIIYIIKPNK